MAIHFGDTAPPAGAPGDMWWTGGKLALAIDDLTSLQWVQISAMSDTSVPGPWDFPDAPTIGQAFTPSGSSVALTWDGNIWTFPAAAGASMITIADAVPTGSPANTLWWDSDSGELFVNYNDGDSTQFVQINRNAPATTGIAEAPTDGQQYARQSSAWTVVAAGGGGLADAPADGTEYLRKDNAWVNPTAAAGAFLPLDGSLPMTGPLTISGQHPTLSLRSNVSTGGFPAIGIYHNNVQPHWNIDFNDINGTGDFKLGRSPGSPPAPGSMVYAFSISRADGSITFDQGSWNLNFAGPNRGWRLTDRSANGRGDMFVIDAVNDRADFMCPLFVDNVPVTTSVVLDAQMTSMEERLIARICLLEERLAKMEAR